MHGSERMLRCKYYVDTMHGPPGSTAAMRSMQVSVGRAVCIPGGSHDKKADLGASETGAHFVSFN